MASNALSGRRQPLRRPKVCETPTNPGRCEPPPQGTYACYFTPPSIVIVVGDGDSLAVSACATHLPTSEEVNAEVSALLGEIGSPETEVDNCDAAGEYPYTAPDDPGEDTVTCTCLFSDGGSVVQTLIATVIEEEED